MAAYIGKNGSVRNGTALIGYVDSFTLNPSVEIVDITSYGSTWKDKAQTIRDWKGSITMTLDRSDTEQAALLGQIESGGTLADVTLRLYITSQQRWQGNALLAGLTVNSKVSDKVGVSINFEGNGACAFSSS
jgi:predicted secreted protein